MSNFDRLRALAAVEVARRHNGVAQSAASLNNLSSTTLNTMPRLGGGVSDNNRGSDSRRNAPAMAYQNARQRFPVSNLMLILFFTFILRNMFFHDYRKDEISQLKASGKSAEEISKIVPGTQTERRQTMQERKAEYETLKQDVKLLKMEVERLKAKLGEDSEDVPPLDQAYDEAEEVDKDEESDHEPPTEEEEEDEVEEVVEEEEEVDEETEEEEIVVKPKPVASHAKLRKTVKKKADPVPAKKTVKKKVPTDGTAARKVVKKKTVRKKPKVVKAEGMEPPIEA